jgi:hypothetical protein
MSQDSPPQQCKPRWTFVSVALFVIGLLILIPSGLCTALIGLPFAFSSLGGADSQMASMILIFGVVPMALGAALVYAGLQSRRRD